MTFSLGGVTASDGHEPSSYFVLSRPLIISRPFIRIISSVWRCAIGSLCEVDRVRVFAGPVRPDVGVVDHDRLVDGPVDVRPHAAARCLRPHARWPDAFSHDNGARRAVGDVGHAHRGILVHEPVVVEVAERVGGVERRAAAV